MANISFVRVISSTRTFSAGVNLSYPAKLVSLGEDKYVFTFFSDGSKLPGGQYGQMLTATGAKVGSPFLLLGANELPSFPDYPVVTGNNGNIQLNWIPADVNSSEATWLSRTIAADGTVLSSATIATVPTPVTYVNFKISDLGSGLVVATLPTEQTTSGSSTTHIDSVSGFWSPDGGFTGFTFHSAVMPVFSGIPDWKNNKNAPQLVAHFSNLESESGKLKGIVVNSDGSTPSSSFDIFDGGTGFISDVRAASLADGGYVVAWYFMPSVGPTSYQFRILNADGTARTPVIDLDSFYGNSFDGLLALPDGRFIAYEAGYAGSFKIFSARGETFFYPLDGYPKGGRHTVFSTNDAGELVIIGQGDNNAYVTVVDLTVFDGSRGNDTWIGGNFSDTIYGIEGSDSLLGGNGNDSIDGGDGKDKLYGNSGSDKLVGGADDDLLDGGSGADRLVGSSGSDTASYYSASFAKVSLDGSIAHAGAALGDKFISIENLSGSNTGDDVLVGNLTSNILSGNGGSDKLFGKAGDDVLMGGAGKDWLSGGIGSDAASYAKSSGVVVSLLQPMVNSGEAQGDTFISIENLIGSTKSADRLFGNSAANMLDGSGGDDRLYGDAGNDVLNGGSGADVLIGGAGADRLDGGAGFDVADYSLSKGVSVWMRAPDLSTGEAAGDSFLNVECVRGSSRYSDTIVGGSKSDVLLGGGGNDILNGGGGADVLRGGKGQDTLAGGGTGELRPDEFHYLSPGEGGDNIVDFGYGDRIVLDAEQFGGVAGMSALGHFSVQIDNVARYSEHNFILRLSDYSLWFDRDGNGAIAPVMIATFQNKYFLSDSEVLFE